MVSVEVVELVLNGIFFVRRIAPELPLLYTATLRRVLWPTPGALVVLPHPSSSAIQQEFFFFCLLDCIFITFQKKNVFPRFSFFFLHFSACKEFEFKFFFFFLVWCRRGCSYCCAFWCGCTARLRSSHPPPKSSRGAPYFFFSPFISDTSNCMHIL